MNSAEMKRMAKLLRKEDIFVEICIADVKEMVRKDKQHLASTLEFSQKLII